MKQWTPIKKNTWVVITEDGLWGTDIISFSSKKEAIQQVSYSTLDSRNKPKVKRWANGVYEYTPKDVDTNTDGDSYLIRKVKDENIEEVNAMWKEQWEEENN